MAVLQRRPWPIHMFAVILIALGLWSLIEVLLDLNLHTNRMQRLFSNLDWNEDLTIIWASARFTIVCIPVVAIWVFANRIARWLISLVIGYQFAQFILSALKIYGMGAFDSWLRLNFDAHLTKILSAIAVALLFTPAANAWFQASPEMRRKETDVATFE